MNQFTKIIAAQLKLREQAVENTLELLEEGCTIPFISRYRKEKTGNMDEVNIEAIAQANDKLKEMAKRKETILKTIDEQGKLTDALKKRIEECWDATELEDIYLPFKPKRRTRAQIAREAGLEPLAQTLLFQRERNIMQLAKKYVGALIVIERGVPLKDIMDTGEEIDAKINQRLIENIFFKNSPLHDGAMVVSNKRIMAAGCILPVSHNLDIPKELGLRHRAALGISQSSDAIAVIVSEETGRISVAIKGEFKLRLSAEELESILTQEML